MPSQMGWLDRGRGPQGPEATAHLLSDLTAGPANLYQGCRGPGRDPELCLPLISLGKGCFRPFSRWHS